MLLAVNTAKMAKGEFLRSPIQITQQLMQKPGTTVRNATNPGFECPSHHKVKAVIKSHPAMVDNNQLNSCVTCQIGMAKNAQMSWSHKISLAPPPVPAAPLSGNPPPLSKPPAPPGDHDGNESYELEGIPSLCVYIHSSHPNTQLAYHNAYGKDSKGD
jgi:hypothetical protein